MPSDVADIPKDEALVRSLLNEQFPEWARLPVRRFARSGNDHVLFRLGDAMSVRLPAASRAVPQVEKEQRWLPRIAADLPLRIPAVAGVGTPTPAFPAPWSVYDWIAGEPAAVARIVDRADFAATLGGFLAALHRVDTTDAPGPGEHSAWRGAPPARLDEEVQAILPRLAGVERDRAAGIWREAKDAPPNATPTWFHGDVSVNNLLVRDGALAAVIDFGCAGIGDPACDTTILWTFFDDAAGRVFRRTTGFDEQTWARGRGWALWKALVMITNEPAEQRALARHVLDGLFAGM